MAKNPGPGFFDQHIEKVILAVCVVIALFCVWHFGASTPLRLEVPTGMARQTVSVPPAEVDSSLFNAAKRLESKINKIPADEIMPRNDVAVLKNFQEYPVGSVELASVDFGVPMYAGKQSDTKVYNRDTFAKLADVIKEMPAPAKPVSWTGMELLSVMDYTGDETASEGDLREDPVWRAVTWYPMKELEKKWKSVFGQTIIVPQYIVLGYEVQIQEQRPDGKWQDVEDITPFKMPIAQAEGSAAADQPPVIPDFVVTETGENNSIAARQAITDLESWMFVKLQPDYFDVWTQEGKISWRRHMPLEIIKSLFAEKPEETPAAGAVRSRTDLRTRAAARMRQPGAIPPDMLMPGMMPPAPGRTGGAVGGAVYRANISRRGSGRSNVAEANETIPTENEQMAAGKPLAWFHVNTIQFGKKYRCRFRWIFVNPLFAYTQGIDPENPSDATVKQIESPWSEWSDSICVNRKMEFFITGANSQNGELTVTVFTEVLGQLVRARFGNVGIGTEVGGNAEVSVLNPATGTRQKMQLNFDANAIVIDLSFNRRVITSSGRLMRDAVEMVYTDENGDVRSRVMYDDQNSPEYLALMDEAERNEPEKVKPESAAGTAKPDKKRTRTTEMPPGVMPPMDFPGGQMPGAIAPRRR